MKLSSLVRTSVLSAVLAVLGACVPNDPGGQSGSGGSGSGGSGSGGSGSGGSGSGGSSSGGSGSGGSGSGGSHSGGSSSGGSGSGGSGSGSGGSCAASSTSSTATFAQMKVVIGFYCGGTGCHNAGQAPDLFPKDDATLYKTLTEYKVKDCGNRVLVKPCAPEESAFYRVQSGSMTCDPVPRMPFGCGVGSCTSDDDLEDVRQWIAKGAPKN
ncbi:MAG TPA: hypothetical protein VHU40_07125 [Polyangia bacterium]|nr:hypothetical protein [Polyangia bacterium]